MLLLGWKSSRWHHGGWTEVAGTVVMKRAKLTPWRARMVTSKRQCISSQKMTIGRVSDEHHVEHFTYSHLLTRCSCCFQLLLISFVIVVASLWGFACSLFWDMSQMRRRIDANTKAHKATREQWCHEKAQQVSTMVGVTANTSSSQYILMQLLPAS